MDIKKIYDLIDRIEKSNLTKFEYIHEGTKIVLEKNNGGISEVKPVGINETVNTPVTEQIIDNAVKSPIVGTFYSKASPDAERFVSVGDAVKKGDVLCIIEAMKLFNEIQAEYDGTVKQILVNDGDMVAFDQPIMIIE